MQQNDALVSLNGRLVAVGMRTRKRRVGVQPLPREIARRERRVFAMRSPGNREDGRGIVAKRRSRAKAGARPPKSTIATLAPSSMAQPRASKTSPVTQVLS